MAATLGRLTLDLIARIGGFTGPLNDASAASKKFAADVKSLGTAVGVGLAGAFTLAAGAATAMVATQLEVIGNQDDMAKRLRTTVESLGILTRAGELSGVSLSQIEGGAQKLELALGKAAAGSKKQVEAFDRLGLSWKEVGELPLDERITAVNEALAKNVPAAERAAVAASLFGAKNAAAFAMLDAETLAEANRQIEVFGVKLNDVDSSKVEAAGDAVSIFSLAADGLSKQLTVAVSPALSKLSTDFLDSAEAAGGLGNKVQEAVDATVQGAAFIVSAGDGVVRAFDVIANTLLGVYTTAAGDIQSLSADIAEALANLPDFAGGEGFAQQAAQYRSDAQINLGIAQQAADKIRENLEKPLAGEAFKKWFEDAKRESQQAAEEAAANRKAEQEGQAETNAAATAAHNLKLQQREREKEAAKEAEKAAKKAAADAIRDAEALNKKYQSTADGYAKRLALTEKMTEAQKLAYELEQGNLVGINAEQQQRLEDLAAELDLRDQIREADQKYADLVKDLRTDDEVRNDLLRERLNLIQQTTAGTPDDRSKQAGRAIAESTEDVPEFAGLAPEVGGPFGEFQKLDEAEQELDAWYKKQTEMLAANREERSDLNKEWDAEELALKQQHENSLAGIEKARRTAGLASMSDFFGQLATLRDSDSKKGHTRGKAAAIAQATINAYTAATGAYASASAIPVVGWVLGPVAAGVALAAGLANVAQIKGQAHDGIMSVPSSGTWNLEKGERVTTAGTSAKLDRTLEDIQRGNRGSQAAPQINISLPGMTDAKQARESSAALRRSVAEGVRQSQRYS